MSHDVKYNAKKSVVMIFRYATLKGWFNPEFKLKYSASCSYIYVDTEDTL